MLMMMWSCFLRIGMRCCSTREVRLLHFPFLLLGKMYSYKEGKHFKPCSLSTKSDVDWTIPDYLHIIHKLCSENIRTNVCFLLDTKKINLRYILLYRTEINVSNNFLFKYVNLSERTLDTTCLSLSYLLRASFV